ncbi:hypothetical protein OG533_18720 [Streptomyces sp. NBC_01186]|uniref:hypothetical protein n=1 Tax=unclassified Streptomyces TaxID=2593676 RepID=UPI002DDA9E54|nr:MULTISPECIES: hypothetical protein [unclassified Streptomyces]WSB78059.1 hypothetical protein OHB04_21260 [Streptomyces sp. NBC_01775]WSS13689.1 hypothetical protein OG533_18720 [Streptomyces sp. NBC_01186]
MHMNTAPHLLREDRPEFERVLDEALRTAHRRADLAAIGQRLNAEQLRTMALSAATAIAACAEAEYHQFVRLREELRRPENAPSVSGRPSSGGGSGAVTTLAGAGGEAAGGAKARGAREGGGESVGNRLAGAMGSDSLAEAGGAGLVAMVSVLAPVLAGTAAVIFLLLGYALHLLTPEPAVAGPIRSAGWVFAALAAAGILVATAGLLLAAMRNGAGAARAPGGDKGNDPGAGRLAEEVALARTAWREALMERGIVPFLREALADPRGPEQAPSTFVPRESRLGYSHPGFSSRPSSESPDRTETRPRFSSPDYSSPDYGGPDTPPA